MKTFVGSFLCIVGVISFAISLFFPFVAASSGTNADDSGLLFVVGFEHMLIPMVVSLGVIALGAILHALAKIEKGIDRLTRAVESSQKGGVENPSEYVIPGING